MAEEDVTDSGDAGTRPADLLLAFAERSDLLIGIADDRGVVTYLNPTARQRLGVGADEAELTTADVFGPDVLSRYFEEIRPTLLEGAAWTGVLSLRDRSGTSFDVDATIVAGLGPGGEVTWLVVAARDRTPLLEHERDLRWRALHDPLTGLANRALLLDRLGVALARARRSGSTVALVFVDVDDLKRVNDTQGHAVGDELLREVARRLEGAVRPSDTVARLGGDEFVVVCEGLVDEPGAHGFGERLRDAVEAGPVVMAVSQVPVNVSIGLAMSHAGDVDTHELLRRADAAMFRAKTAAKDRVAVFDLHMREEDRRRDKLLDELVVGLTQQAFVPWFRPVVSLEDGRALAQQAVARWNHPERGVVPAREFIDVIEGTGAAMSLDLTILRAAMLAAVTWPAPSEVEVFASNRLLGELRLQRLVAGALERSGLPAGRLRVLVPERALLGRTGVGQQVTQELLELGVAVGLHASASSGFELQSVAALSIDELLVDGRLVARALAEPALRPALRALVAMGKGLGVRVVAEVDDPVELQLARDVGADAAVGDAVGVARPTAVFDEGGSPSSS